MTDLNDLTIADYDRIVDGDVSDSEYELIGGALIMQPDQCIGHAQVVSNIGAPLRLAMDARGCRTYFGGRMAVQASGDTTARDKYKPDILVVCGPRNNKNRTVIDPVIVVQVLSPSTMDYDRGRKLEIYKTFPTLQHIVIAYSDQRRVESYAREASDWAHHVLIARDDKLILGAVEFEIALDEIYDDTDLA